MDDMKQTIIPKSDQLNADDLISGPMTITITRVEIKGGTEQPVSIHFEGDNGKPYKSCKSMNRVIVAAWGGDSKKYAGRSMTLYRDEKVKWAGMEVGGIRISHMSDIADDMTMALTVTRANKKPFTVRPLPRTTKAAPQPLSTPPSPASAAGAAPIKQQSAELTACLTAIESVKGKNGAAAVADMIGNLDDAAEREFAVGALDWQIAELKKRSVKAKEPLGGVLEMKDDLPFAAKPTL